MYKFRFQHFNRFTNQQMMNLIEDAAARQQINKHAKLGWAPVQYSTKSVSVCTIENEKREVIARGYLFLRERDLNTSKEARRKITQGRAMINLMGRRAWNQEKRKLRQEEYKTNQLLKAEQRKLREIDLANRLIEKGSVANA